MLAAESGCEHVVEQLIAIGAQVNRSTHIVYTSEEPSKPTDDNGRRVPSEIPIKTSQTASGAEGPL